MLPLPLGVVGCGQRNALQRHRLIATYRIAIIVYNAKRTSSTVSDIECRQSREISHVQWA
jgi:hypothetical protein